ncbi:LOW QUALITY PROTEIN: hypothetical protein PHMEG_00024881 [Phytophthora megakarya]|uniref:Integrase catalytic domain-containing protein n=1 Tax=Phytophthora megakarya TaxID=4795 RepID=A0A225VCH1_9STRA|nr:LOW QUALITY PROTEIN: hypothetical protein PHMEG_00024881 [Phytophthora megakarya]
MAFPGPEAELLQVTDASDKGFSIIVTQVRHWDESLPVENQKHEMIVCKGGMFRHSELNWTIIKKEAFPVVKACHELDYLLLRPRGFRLYCDHANLAFIFAPSVELKKHVRDRLQHWVIRLCGLRYTIEFIPGENNVWADIVSRWHVRDQVSVAAVRTRSHQVIPVDSLSRLRPLADDGFHFPTRDDIKAAQQDASRERSRLQGASEDEVDGVVTVNNRVWVPTGAKDLLARLFVVAHCGSQGHRGQEPMSLVLKERFYVLKLEDKVAKFIRQCLLCKHFKGPRQIPRPYEPLLTTNEQNEVDFLSLREGFGGSSYLLVVKDGVSHLCELFPCATPTAFIAAEALAMWCARYGIPKTLLSDQGSHFRNEMAKNLAARLKVKLNFTPVYSAWLNGTVGRLNRDVLPVFRALLMEYGLDDHEWPYLLPAVQAILNHTRVQSLAGRASVEVFTALPASSALDAIVLPAITERSKRLVDLNDISGYVDCRYKQFIGK